MMFLEYAVPGTTAPILSLYLKDQLNFLPYQIGIVLAMPALAAIFAPFAASHLADRYISAERMLSLCHLGCGLCMMLLTRVQSYPLFVLIYTCHGVCFMPTLGLTNAVALHYIPDARRSFSGIRMWGTVSWVVVAWGFGYVWMSGDAPGVRLSHALPLAGLFSLALALYALSFRPAHHSPVQQRKGPYRDVLRLFLRPGMLLLCFLTFLNSACHQFYYFGMGLHLNQIGVPKVHIMPGMSIGQASEVAVLAIMGWFLLRFKVKTLLLLGVLAQCLRMLIFAFAEKQEFLLAGISLHGFCFAFFFITAYLYVETHSTSATRAGAQQVLGIMISGAGPLAGFLGAGWTAEWCTDPRSGLVDFRMFWLVPALLCVVIGLWLMAGFHEASTDSSLYGRTSGAAKNGQQRKQAKQRHA